LDRASAKARAVGDEARKRLLRVANRSRFEQDFLRQVPARFAPAARFAFYADWTGEERRLGRDIEGFRRRIASLASGDTMASLPSPRAGDFQLDEHGRSQGAALKRSAVADHARTGVHPEGGMLLQRIVSGIGAKRILELGTNTGFSGCYFVTAPSKPHLVTVEGSKELCELATKNISRYSQSFSIMNQLFDEAIDELGAKGEHFDCAFIDGQHERLATIHYAERVHPLMQPGGVVVFDDLYWSDGMNQAWKELCMSPRYGLTIDLGWKGLAVLGTEQPKRHLDLCDYIGRPRIAPRDSLHPPT
jgi:predicted O-methyltransferase YrrM